MQELKATLVILQYSSLLLLLPFVKTQDRNWFLEQYLQFLYPSSVLYLHNTVWLTLFLSRW